MKLNAETVNKIFTDCLLKDEEIFDGIPILDPVKVEGIINNFDFHPDRLESHRQEIIELLAELPEQFRKDSGGGWTFLNACNDKYGNQWAELHRDMEQLFVLGIGLKLCDYAMPRELWNILPSGMPYMVIN